MEFPLRYGLEVECALPSRNAKDLAVVPETKSLLTLSLTLTTSCDAKFYSSILIKHPRNALLAYPQFNRKCIAWTSLYETIRMLGANNYSTNNGRRCYTDIQSCSIERKAIQMDYR